MTSPVPQPMFPLQSALLPGEVLPLRIFEPRYAQLVQDCLAMTEPAFGVVLITRGREVGGGDVRGDVGVLAHIAEYAELGFEEFILSGYPHLEEAWRVGDGLLPELRRRRLIGPAPGTRPAEVFTFR